MPKKIGRPPKDEATKKGAHLSIRMTAALRHLLDDARRHPEGERSLNQEIELRLWQSFTAQKDAEQRFGGAKTAAFLEVIANRIRSIEVGMGADHHWLDNRFVFEQVRVMLNIVLDHFKPPGRRIMPRLGRLLHPALRKHLDNMGRREAFTMLAMLKIAASDKNLPAELPPVELKRAADLLATQIHGTPCVEYEKMRKKLNSALPHASSKRRMHR